MSVLRASIISLILEIKKLESREGTSLSQVDSASQQVRPNKTGEINCQTLKPCLSLICEGKFKKGRKEEGEGGQKGTSLCLRKQC